MAKYVRYLFRDHSRLLKVFFNEEKVTPEELKTMQTTLLMLSKLPADQVRKIVPESETFFDDMELLGDFVEELYNFWRRLQRLIVLDSVDDRLVV